MCELLFYFSSCFVCYNISLIKECFCRENFFKDAGEVQEVRFSTHEDGSFKGYGHVEFVTAEAAQKVVNFSITS